MGIPPASTVNKQAGPPKSGKALMDGVVGQESGKLSKEGPQLKPDGEGGEVGEVLR